MALIKNANAELLMRDAIALDLGDLSHQAQRIIDEARRESRQIIEQARAEAQRLIDTADQIGHAEGLERGMAEGRAAGEQAARQAVIEQFTPQVQGLVERWTAAIDSWEQDRQRMLTAARQDVLAMGLAIGRRVAHRLPKVDQSVIEDQLVEALSLLTRPSAVSVRVHPDDAKLMEQVMPALRQRMEHAHEISLIEDESIDRGGCVLSTAAGRIDATLHRQLDRIVEALLPDRSDVAGAADSPT
jgi:flagellar assembly protein FliH